MKCFDFEFAFDLLLIELWMSRCLLCDVVICFEYNVYLTGGCFVTAFELVIHATLENCPASESSVVNWGNRIVELFRKFQSSCFQPFNIKMVMAWRNLHIRIRYLFAIAAARLQQKGVRTKKKQKFVFTFYKKKKKKKIRLLKQRLQCVGWVLVRNQRNKKNESLLNKQTNKQTKNTEVLSLNESEDLSADVITLTQPSRQQQYVLKVIFIYFCFVFLSVFVFRVF
jgi:hypothetical protein